MPRVWTLLALVVAAQDTTKLPALEFGKPTAGEILESDPRPAQVYAPEDMEQPKGRSFVLDVPAGAAWYVDLESYAFDAFIAVCNESEDEVIASENDGPLAPCVDHARVVVPAQPEARRYVIEACALHAESGPFTLCATRGEPPTLSAAELDGLCVRETSNWVRFLEPKGDSEALAVALNQGCYVHWRARRFADALPLATRALAIREKLYGPDDPRLARSVGNVAVQLDELGQGERALPLFVRQLALLDRRSPPDLDRLAATLEQIAGQHLRHGRAELAEPLLVRQIEARAAKYGPDAACTAEAHVNHAEALEQLGRLAESRDEFRAALAVLAKEYGEANFAALECLRGIAFADAELGDTEDAERTLAHAIEIYEKQPQPDLSRLALAYDQRGNNDIECGRIDRAVQMHEHALALRVQCFGPTHFITAMSRNNLAIALRERGDLTRALAEFRQALEDRLRAQPAGDVEAAVIRGNIGWCLHALGRFAEAREQYEAAIAEGERIGGTARDRTMTIHGNLGTLLAEMGQASEARPHRELMLAWIEARGVENVLSIRMRSSLALDLEREKGPEAARALAEENLERARRALGDSHPDVAAARGVLAHLLWNSGERERAVEIESQSLADLERATSPSCPAVLSGKLALAGRLRDLGRLDAARALLDDAQSVLERDGGLLEDDLANALVLRARIELAAGRAPEAWAALRRGLDLTRSVADEALAALTESERLRWLSGKRVCVEAAIDLVGAHPELHVEDELLGAVLRWRGIAGRAMLRRRSEIAGHSSAEQRELLAALQATQSRLSRAAFDPAAAQLPPAEMRKLLDERNRLELALQRTAPPLAPEAALDVPRLRAALPPRSALVAFMQNCRNDEAHSHDPDASRMTAWVVRAGVPEATRVELGTAHALEAAVRAFLDEHVSRGAGAVRATGSDRNAELRAILWDPLARELDGVDLVFVAPDSFLGALPFGAIADGEGRYLLEKRGFVVLDDLGTALRAQPIARGSAPELLVVGGVDFGAARHDDGAALARLERGGFTDFWEFLTSTPAEAQAVLDLHEGRFGATAKRELLAGGAADEASLKRAMPGRQVLHLATHGFFAPTGLPHMWEEVSSGGRVEMQMRADEAELLARHPGLLSGLVCSGANLAAAANAPGEDGLLTAEEVTWLDLSSAELVVLSACESALGRAQTGEGLLGLRRAFHLAGARTVVSSLWSVRDDTTQAVMRDFYRGLWSEHLGTFDALRAAQLAQLKRDRIAKRGDRPGTWAAFVLSGEWR